MAREERAGGGVLSDRRFKELRTVLLGRCPGSLRSTGSLETGGRMGTSSHRALPSHARTLDFLSAALGSHRCGFSAGSTVATLLPKERLQGGETEGER